jgi:hypothetical protein
MIYILRNISFLLSNDKYHTANKSDIAIGADSIANGNGNGQLALYHLMAVILEIAVQLLELIVLPMELQVLDMM